MKKYFSLLILVLILFLVSCSKEEDNDNNNNVEQGEEITLNIIGLKGIGTLENPYELNMNQGESIVVSYEISDGYEISYLPGVINNSKFEAIDEDLVQISKIEERDNLLLIKTKLDATSHYIDLSSEGSKTHKYIKVNVKTIGLDQRFHVLSIGNSFSEDAFTYLYDIAASAGIEDVFVGYLYTGGAPLERHWNNFSNGTSYERFSYNNSGTWRRDTALNVKIAINKYEWDYIALQQASGYSGVESAFVPYLDNLIDGLIEENIIGSTYIWQETWAYSKTSGHSDFPKYNNNQEQMFNAIIDAVDNLIVPNVHIEKIIPSGMVIQALREEGFSEGLITRDGYHLNLIHARYAVGLMWYRQISGLSLDLVTYVPKGISPEQLATIKKVVNDVYENPYLLYLNK